MWFTVITVSMAYIPVNSIYAIASAFNLSTHELFPFIFRDVGPSRRRQIKQTLLSLEGGVTLFMQDYFTIISHVNHALLGYDMK